MRVQESNDHPTLQNHVIQFGVSTWTENEREQNQTLSIRRAVYNDDGVFSPHGSSEIPLEDMGLLIRSCLERDLIDLNEIGEILSEVSSSIIRLEGR